jgi:hypothetical protein
VADTICAVERMLGEDFLKVLKLSRGAAHLKKRAVGAADSDPGRVVSAILETPQALNDDGQYFLRANITDNSAHMTILCDGPAPVAISHLSRILLHTAWTFSFCQPCGHGATVLHDRVLHGSGSTVPNS